MLKNNAGDQAPHQRQRRFVLLKLVTKLKLMCFLFILCVVTEVGTCVFYLISGLFCCLLAIKNEMNVGCRSLSRHTGN